jgi:hypothetical protein
MHDFQSNSTVHGINTRYKNQLHIPSVRPAIQRGTAYSAIKIFGTLPHRNTRLKNYEIVFKAPLRKYLLTRFLVCRNIFVR